MYISRATKADINAISYLMQESGKMSVSEDLFNNRDIALQAREDSGELIGFLWCGLMAKNSIGYLDKLAVSKKGNHKLARKMLGLAMKDELVKRKVRSVFGLIMHDQYHDRAAINALQWAFGAHSAPYTYVEADVQNSIKELEALNGR